MTHHQQTAPLPLRPGLWALDPAHSAIVFSVRHLGLSKVRGQFVEFDATMSVGQSLDEVHVDATIEMASVNTNNHDRDVHLRSTDFFSIDTHPTMRFRSSRIVDDGNFTLHGDLAINGVTRPISFPAEFNGIASVQDSQHAGFTATTDIRRSDYGINFGVAPAGADRVAIADTIKVGIDLQFIEPETR